MARRHVVLDAAFGRGDRFAASLHRFQSATSRADRLVCVALAPLGTAPCAELAPHWPPPTPADIHRLSLFEGRVELLLCFGTLAQWLPQWVVAAHEIIVSQADWAAFAREAGDRHAFKALARVAAPGALLRMVGSHDAATVSVPWNAARAAGFEPGPAVPADHPTLDSPPFATTREPGAPPIARFAPPAAMHRPPSRWPDPPLASQRAVIIGAGLAGCAAAWALAEQGWSCRVFDAESRPAAVTSGNPGGLFHGIVHRHDGVHAAFNRAAALEAAQAVRSAGIKAREAVADAGSDGMTPGTSGSATGLLRLEADTEGPADMQDVIDALGLPPQYVQALAEADVALAAGVPLRNAKAAWFYPGGGWVDPRALCRAFLAQAGASAELQLDTAVHGLQWDDTAAKWTLLDESGRSLAQAEVVVLACGLGVEALLSNPQPFGAPLTRTRGQVSLIDAASAGVALPRIPVAGRGYVLPLGDGQALVGATSQAGEDDPFLREDDHRANLQALADLLPVASGRGREQSAAFVDLFPVRGRSGTRLSTPDRLPLIGPVPDLATAPGRHAEQARHQPRLPGLYTLTALGSRGITWSALSARILASWITGAPFPVPARLIDATDPARFAARRNRHAQG